MCIVNIFGLIINFILSIRLLDRAITERRRCCISFFWWFDLGLKLKVRKIPKWEPQINPRNVWGQIVGLGQRYSSIDQSVNIRKSLTIIFPMNCWSKSPQFNFVATFQDLLAQHGTSQNLVILIDLIDLFHLPTAVLQTDHRHTSRGFLFSPVVADIFMGTFEEVALQSFMNKPKAWFWYVGDTFIIIHLFLELFDNQPKDFKVTMGIKSNNSLPFLDVLVSRLYNGRLVYSV